MNKCLVLPVSRPAFPCFFLILITLSSVRVPETCLWSGPGWYVCTCMCSVLSPPPSILCVCMYPPAASRLCLFEKLAALSDGPNGWTPGNPNMQALKLPSRPACPMQLQFLPISHVPAHLHLSNCSSFTHLSLLYETPHGPTPSRLQPSP